LPRRPLTSTSEEPREGKSALRLPSVQSEDQRPDLKLRFRGFAIGHRIASLIPHHDRPGAVVSVGNDPFQVDVLDGVAWRHHGEA
jgi:hypothetical protein